VGLLDIISLRRFRLPRLLPRNKHLRTILTTHRPRRTMDIIRLVRQMGAVRGVLLLLVQARRRMELELLEERGVQQRRVRGLRTQWIRVGIRRRRRLMVGERGERRTRRVGLGCHR